MIWYALLIFGLLVVLAGCVLMLIFADPPSKYYDEINKKQK